MNEFLRIKSRDYTTIPNHFLRDKSLSCKAKGVLSMILALPDDWDFSVKGMVSIIKDGESALRSAITELRNQGYCVMSRPKENGRYTKVVYVFSGEPITEEDVRGYIEQSEKKEEEAEEPHPTEETQDDFEVFWQRYDKKVDKQGARRAWNRLSKKDKAAALEGIKPYQEARHYEKRIIQHPTTYLHRRTWEDDFSDYEKKAYYEVREGDDERVKAYKSYMQSKHQRISEAHIPLSYAGYLRLVELSNVDYVEEKLTYIEENIDKFRYSDVEKIITGWLREKED